MRAVAGRQGTIAIVFSVAVVAVAAAAAGPAYYSAARTSVLRDTVSTSSVLGHGYEVTQAGLVDTSFAPINTDARAALGTAYRLFSAPIESRQALAFDSSKSEGIPLVWRSGICSHLQIQGSCPSGPRQIVVSRHLASANDWRAGQQLGFPTWGVLTITGIYAPPTAASDYWSDLLSTYFPTEFPSSGGSSASAFDAMFTASQSLLTGSASTQGTLVVDATLDTATLNPSNVGSLSGAVGSLMGNAQLFGIEAVVTSTIPSTMAAVRSSWSSLAAPVLVITLELLGLAVLLLYLLVTDATAARGPEIALAKLRGYKGWRLASFALAEPTLILVLAVPVGALVGWSAAILLGHGLLRPGTPVGFPATALATIAAASLGGLVAVAAASVGTLRRPVMEQWRQADRNGSRRGWIADAVLLTGAVAGLGELAASGTISASHQHPLTLLVPALVGVSVAVIGSRLLPLACSLVAGHSRRIGVAGYLALRQVARRPGGSRTTIILASSFALATFAIAAWSLGQTNYQRVASEQLGAPTVFDVSTPAGLDLATAVAAADPSGTVATPVEEYPSAGSVTLAVDPARWDRIARWEGGSLSQKTVAALDPPAPPPLVLTGDAVRIGLDIAHLAPALSGLTIDVLTRTGFASTPVAFAALPNEGVVTVTAALPPCPCVVEDLTLEANPSLESTGPLVGSLTVTTIEVHQDAQWRRLPNAILSSPRWRPDGPDTNGVALRTEPAGLRWTFDVPGTDPVSLDLVDRPDPLPSVAATAVTGGKGGLYTATGLDGRDLPVSIFANRSTIPGAPANGVVVDLSYADLAAAGDSGGADQQVWVSAGHAGPIRAKLKQEGVTVNSQKSTGALAKSLSRSGPGLAQFLFLAEAGAAAVLAAGGAVLSLYLFARRRRYELASLVAVGIKARTLALAVIAEQLIVLSYGCVLGVGAGLVTAGAVLRYTPEFQTPPTGLTLSTFPPVATLAAVLAGAVFLTLAVGVAAGAGMVGGVTLAELREAAA